MVEYLFLLNIYSLFILFFVPFHCYYSLTTNCLCLFLSFFSDHFSEQLDLFLKGQTDAIQEENEVTEDPDLTIDRDGKILRAFST